MRDQAALALQIEQQKAAQAKALAQQKAAESGSYAGKIKAYTTPIIVVGVLTIGGIAAYFYFKKKKIS
jgi:LPXTG-motif cell wall-anchored protein